MTFAVLRSLYGIIGEALDDIEQVYQSHGQDPTDGVAVDGDRDRELSARDSSPQSSPRSNVKSSTSYNNKGSSFIRHRSSLSGGSFSAICSKAYASPPPSPCVTNIEQRFEPKMTKISPSTTPNNTSSTSYSSAVRTATPVDFPSLDATFVPASPAETLTAHPKVVAAINRIIGACGQMTATVQTPFLTICDSVMGYHLPACMRIVEAGHVAEIIKEHGAPGLHVDRISQLCGINGSKLAHILRLLATHHIFREISPDVFALNRISSVIDSGKAVKELVEYQNAGRPELKYQGTNGIAAFVGLCADEIGKASMYMTEAYLLSSSPRIREANQPTLTPFAFAFGAIDHKVDYFGWLEGEDTVQCARTELGHGSDYSSAVGLPDPQTQPIRSLVDLRDASDRASATIPDINRFRLERFGKAMSGTGSWEAPGAIFKGFDWASLSRGSIIVDVGGGIGSTSMLLAAAFSPPNEDLGLKFIIQDREPVTIMGEKAWREKLPGLLENGTTIFRAHDFFIAQPVKDAAVFLLRVVLHDWPDDYARKILVHLREAATPQTKLLLADFVLPLACADDITSESGLEDIEGAQRELVPTPLLPNLGKASANGYWMDLTMNVMFNSQERTLREITALTLSAGWKVTKVTQPPGSLFGYILAIPVMSDPSPEARTHSSNDKPRQHKRANAVSNAWSSGWDDTGNGDGLEDGIFRRPQSRCGTPTFGSKMEPPGVADTLAKFGGGVRRYRGPGTIGRALEDRRSSSTTSTPSSASFSPSASTSSLTSSLAAPSLKPAANIVLAKQRSAFDIRSSFNSDAHGHPSAASSMAFSRSTSSQSVTVHPDARRPRSPSPINLQIANAPRLPPPPTPPRSIRRPSSLANMRSRTISLPQSDPLFIPPLPSMSPLHCSSFSGVVTDSKSSAGCERQVENSIPQRVMSPTPSYGRALRGRSSLNQLTSYGIATTAKPAAGACAPRDYVPSTSLPAYSQAPAHASCIPVRSSILGGSSIPRASPAFATSASTRSMHVNVSQQIGMGQHGASVCVNFSPQRTQPVLKEVGRRASSAQLGSGYSNYATRATALATQVRFSESPANDGIGRSPTPLTSTSKKSSGPSIPVRANKQKSSRPGVANFMRGAGQKLGGMLRFERQEGSEAAKEKIEKLEKKLDAYLTDSERIRGRGGQGSGRSAIFP